MLESVVECCGVLKDVDVCYGVLRCVVESCKQIFF